MSASPAIPGVTPQPAAEPGVVGTPDAAEEPPRGRRRKVVVLLLLLGLLTVLIGLSVWYLLFRQPIPIPTVPGETVMPSYVTAIYGTSRPMGVAVTAAGDRVFAGETDGDQVARVLDAQGTEVGRMEPPLSTGADHVPVYLATNPLNGEIYVTDRPTGSIFVYDSAGTYQRSFTPSPAITGWQPLGLAFDAAGNLYVTDIGLAPQRVRVFDPDGRELRTLGEDAGLSFPNGVAVDANGYVYVADSNNGRLLVFDQDGAIVARVGRGAGAGNLGLPRGLAVDAKDRVYVADSTGQRVLVYGAFKPELDHLEFLGTFGSEGTVNGAFEYPNAVAVDQRGRLYIADSVNDRIQVWSY